MVRLLALVSIVGMLAGCALQHVKVYEGPERAPAEHATLSSIGLYPEQKLSLLVVEIDGQSVDSSRAASYLLLPGVHDVKVTARRNMRPGGGPGISVAYDHAEPVARLEAKAGHTYVPNAVIEGNTIMLSFDDKGTDFPRECLPLQVWINSSGANPGALAWRTEKKCER